MQYEQVWNAVDKLAKTQGLSPSGLAKKAGLDATTFNKSKRIRPDGKNRWPSLDSINKIIEVSGISFDQFYNLMEVDNSSVKFAPSIPFIKFSQLGIKPKISKKELSTNDWSKVRFPDGKDKIYAVDIDNDRFEPFYRFGTLVIVSKNSEIRRGDRILVIKNDGQIEIKEFVRRTSSSVEVNDIFSREEEYSISLKDIKLVNRIVWVSQ